MIPPTPPHSNPLAGFAIAAAFGALMLGLSHCMAPKKEAPSPAALAAPIQAQVDRQVITEIDHVAARAARSQSQTEEAVHAITSAPSAADPLPPDLRAAWLAGVERVRGDGDVAEPAHCPAGSDPCEPPKALLSAGS